MKDLFDYCYYRIAKGYKFWGDSDYCNWGYWVMFASFGFIALTIITLVFHLFHYKIDKTIIICIILSVVILNTYFTLIKDEKVKYAKYEQLDARYKDEKHRRLKGWLVFLYVVGTAILFFASLLMCGYWVDKV